MKKKMQRATRIRLSDYREHRLDIGLSIYSHGNRWEMDIDAREQVIRRIPININAKRLCEINESLREAAGKALHHAQNGAKAELQRDLQGLADEGNLVFMEVFEQRDAWKTMQKLFSQAENITIQITSEDFSIPWELLYSDKPEKPYDSFWGMKYIISRAIVDRETIEPTTIRVDLKPKLGLLALVHESLPSIRAKEIPFFKKLKKDGKIALQQLPGLDPTPANKESELSKFKSFLNRPLDVAHFACHAEYDEKKSLQSYIQLSKGIRISLRDLEKQPKAAINDFPLVILNACKMGLINPMDVHYFAGNLIKYGALGVVATEAAVPDDLAADFTLHLYEHLLNEQYLGESVLAARKELMDCDNPVGLLYALYAPSIIKLQRKRNT
jgi:hypothetical protein